MNNLKNTINTAVLFLRERFRGLDELNIFLLVFGLVSSVLVIPAFRIILLLSGTGSRTAYGIYYACSLILGKLPFLFVLIRCFSKNTLRKTAQNDAFLHIRDRLRRVADGIKKPVFRRGGEKKVRTVRFRDKEETEFIFRECPSCGARLRLKRLKGKHCAVCPRCGEGFTVRCRK